MAGLHDIWPTRELSQLQTNVAKAWFQIINCHSRNYSKLQWNLYNKMK